MKTKTPFIKRLKEYKSILIQLKIRDKCRKTSFCFLIKHTLTKENYPELWSYKPFYVLTNFKGQRFYNLLLRSAIDNFWFTPFNKEKRIKILETIINKMEKRLATFKEKNEIGGRYEEYKYLLKEISSLPEERAKGFCLFLTEHLTKENYPELYAYKPEDVKVTEDGVFKRKVEIIEQREAISFNSSYWFEPKDKETRVGILTAILTNMEERWREKLRIMETAYKL